MKNILSILAVCTVVSASAILQQIENNHQQQQQQSKSTFPEPLNKSPLFQSAQENRLPSSQYYYPTYPEYTNPGYTIQQGYEGYLVPSALLPKKKPIVSSGIITSLIPKAATFLSVISNFGGYLLEVLFHIILGGLFTTALCTFTSLCRIQFLGFGIDNKQVKEQVAELARTYITPESLNTATVLVTKAFEKYSAMQKEHDEKLRQEMKKQAEADRTEQTTLKAE